MPYNNFARSNSTHEEWKIVDRFDSTYWSGLDAQVYFNNILINEAIQVSYMVSEQIRPYYGYASYIPNRIHHGARIIQGELTLNYKRDGYLFSLLQTIRNQSTEDMMFGFESSRNVNASPEVRVPVQYSDKDGNEIWNALASGEFPGKVVRDIVEKRRILNEGDVNSMAPEVSLTSGIFETRLEGFDVNIVFGTNLNGAKALRWIGADEYELEYLDASYGDAVVTEDKQLGTSVFGKTNYNHSAGMKIVGVSIAGMAKTINDDGRALLETYSFTARDLVPLSRVDNRTRGSGVTWEVDETYNKSQMFMNEAGIENYQGQIDNTTNIPTHTDQN